ncbi:NAD(P)H-quinone oxidoreductase [Paraferrimonas sp. SM1919]|uniref:NAD(P)H-quinone oxidoreductase n=1 Tax=Paraferrimonas sp. SM1919 TaxID=2662263 RepID=UPI0013D55B02|nr:NAD(P)H-quinone oxidoreductase [Paraferrimonas sp. SM1919]
MQYIEFIEGEIVFKQASSQPLEVGQIRVKVGAFGINRADLLQRKGHYPPPAGASHVPGLEAMGEVIEVNNAAALKVGDRVMVLLASDGYSSEIICDHRLALKVPESLSNIEAAGFCEVFTTAYQALFEIGKLTAGMKVLIHAGASGVGSAAIQLAKHSGCEVFTTVGSEDKAAYCQKLAADKCINYKEQDYKTELKGVAIDVVVDPIGGEYIDKNLSVMAKGGVIIQLAMMGGRMATIDQAKLLGKRITWQASTLRDRSIEYKQQLLSGLWQGFGERIASKQIIVPVYQSESWQQLEKLHSIMANNQNLGKLIAVVE